MTLVLGTDEAGYGPNLGPLVVAATAWRIEGPAARAEAVLGRAVTAAASLWGDSKRIYRAGAGLRPLERGVLTALALAGGGSPANWPTLAAALGMSGMAAPPEARQLEAITLPRHDHEPACVEAANTVAEALAAAGVRLEAIRCRVVQATEFNGLLVAGLNKADVLSAITLELAATLAARADEVEEVLVWCDRHGGRRRYAPQVARAFAAPLVQPLEETATCSRYRIDSRRAIEFAVGGEARTPVAVASMAAKYVRELAMIAFNRFWCDREPRLGPTAGYPVDALRWRRAAAAAVAAAGIDWDAVWRRA